MLLSTSILKEICRRVDLPPETLMQLEKSFQSVCKDDLSLALLMKISPQEESDALCLISVASCSCPVCQVLFTSEMNPALARSMQVLSGEIQNLMESLKTWAKRNKLSSIEFRNALQLTFAELLKMQDLVGPEAEALETTEEEE